MANQIYKYGTSYSGAGLSSAYSSRLNAASDRYSDASLLESSRYLTSEPAAPNYPTFDRGSTMYSSQAYPASKVAGGIGASATPWASVAPAVDPALVSGVKRPAEALYHQTILGTHNAIGQSEALFSTNSLAKHPRLEIGSNLHNYPQRPGEKDCAYYMLTRTCKFGANCKFDHPLWVPEGGIPGWKEFQPIHTSESLPERPGEPDCPYYTNTQRCRFGLRCKYNHPKSTEASASGLVGENPQTVPTKQDPGSTEQDLAVKDNGVAGGDSNPAKLFIPFTPASLHNSKGLPIRPGETDCSFYQKTGSCKYGASCRYNHPDRNSINLPVAAALGQAIIPSPATNLPIGVVNQAASLLSNIDPRLAQASIAMPPTIYPQRPGQLECDFYMKTGQCKFGERCKFHHPIDRYAPTSQEHSVKLTLAGLPRREGTDACPYYMKTGACNYGVRCRYDHPPPGEAIAMAAVLGAATATGTGAGVTATEGEEDDAAEDDDSDEQL